MDFSVGFRLGSDFNFDFHASITEEQQREGAEYNYERASHPLDAMQESRNPSPRTRL